VQRIHIKLYCFALHPTILPLNFIVVSPFIQDVTTSEVADLSFSFVNKLPVGFGPSTKELVERLDLFGFPVIERTQFLLLNV